MRVVTGANLQIKNDRRKGCIFAVGGLQRVVDTEGPAVLGRVLRTLRDAYDAAPSAFGRARRRRASASCSASTRRGSTTRAW